MNGLKVTVIRDLSLRRGLYLERRGEHVQAAIYSVCAVEARPRVRRA
jgi:hypothetical protein